MVAAAAAAAAVCALYMNCTVPTGECTFEYGRVGADGVLAPLSDLPKLNGGTEALNAQRRARAKRFRDTEPHLLDPREGLKRPRRAAGALPPRGRPLLLRGA